MENTQVGPFLIFERLGTSRRQKVFRARQIEQNIDVAIKFIGMPDEAIRARAIDKIQLEIERLKALKHPNLVRTLGAGVADDQVFFASELIKSESLAKILSRRGKLAADLVVDYGKQTAELLHYLHEQDLMHGKLTPDKLLITRDGLVKVSDMRLNRSKRKKLTSRKRSLDDIAYLAPEQYQEGSTDKSDIYSLGVVLFEMLTGKLPYPPETLGKLAKRKMHATPPSVLSLSMDCPVWLDKLVTKMISPDPKNRPHSARAVILALDELKKMERTKKASVAQVSGTFNPLTIGSDKSEADRILGKSKSGDSDTPFFQSAGFLVGGLVLVMAILIFAMIPTSSKRLMSNAQALMDSEKQTDWLVARDDLKQIMARGEDGQYFKDAEQLYYESRRRSLVVQAEKGKKFALQSFASQQFLDAARLQRDGDLPGAIELFQKLAGSVEVDGDERHIHWEANERIKQLKQELADRYATFEQSIQSAKAAESADDLKKSIEDLKQLVSEAGEAENLQELVSIANQTMQSNQKRLAELSESGDTQEQ